MFDTDETMRIDMSKYMEKHTVSRLLDAPVMLGTTWVVDSLPTPFAIPFDEVEKAHPKVFNVFLQMLDNERGATEDSKRNARLSSCRHETTARRL